MTKQRELTAEFIRERNVFDNEDSRVIIGDARDADTGSIVTIKGEAAEGQLRHSMVYRFYGHTFTHAKYGEQFVFAAFAVETPVSEDATIAYLQQCDGIGPKMAQTLWDTFSGDAIRTLREEPQKAMEFIPKLKENVAIPASEFLKKFAAVERAKVDCLSLLSGRGFPRKTVDNVIQRWGSAAAERLRSNPYLLMAFRGCGFLKTDKMYLDVGLPPGKLKRQALCAWHAIARDSEGHTWHPLGFAQGAIARRISGGQLNAERATELAVRGKLLARREHLGAPWITEDKKARAEERCAIALDEAAAEQPAWPSLDVLVGDDVEQGLSPHQLGELSKSLSGVIGLLTGSPGTGKTYTAAAVIREIIRQCGDSAVAMAAPTGKAAVRLTEAMQANGISVPAVTIHRLLVVQASSDGWSFKHCGDLPLPYSFVFIDEASMLDTSLMAALLEARAPGTHYLFLGDPNQLAPVGHGAPLRDMIAAGVPCGELTEIRRNSGRIVEACAAIREQRRFIPSPQLNPETGENLLHVECNTPNLCIQMLTKFLETIRNGNKYDPVWDVQVLCAVNKKSSLGRRALNDLLQGMLNLGGQRAAGNRFRQGDKIINTKNGWFPSLDKEHPEANGDGKVFVANGEIGEAVIVESSRTICKLQSPDRVVVILQGKQSPAKEDSEDEDDKVGKEDIENEDTGTGSTWDLAYAISTHKSQGSEFPVVVTMIDDHAGAQRLCTRNWIYTALSRAKKLCITIGQRRLVDQMCAKDGLKRRTFLVERIKELAAIRNPPPTPQPEVFRAIPISDDVFADIFAGVA